MSTNYSTIVSCPDYKLLPTSQPYCLFRNRERYVHDVHVNTTAKADGDISSLAENQTTLFLDGLSDNHIPSYLLYGSLRREISLHNSVNNVNTRRQTVTSIHCRGRTKFLHIGGRHLDELVMRDMKHSYEAVSLKTPPGFTLPLSEGAEICEVASCGASQWGAKTNVLARTRSELYHVSTFDVDDLVPGGDGSSVGASVIIEPVQKWQLPYDIACMSVSPTSWSSANILTTCGTVYTWNLADGLRAVSNREPVIPNCSSATRSFGNTIECTVHPQVSLIASKQCIYTLDLRCPQQAPLLHTAAHNIACLKQHGGVAHQCMVSEGDYVRLMDTRFPRTAVAQQYIPGGHNSMKFIKTPNSHTAGVFLGSSSVGSSSSSSLQLYVHSLDGCRSSIGAGGSLAQGSGQHLLHAAAGYGCQDAALWDVDAFPVVDAGDGGGASSGVWGFDLSPCCTTESDAETEESELEEDNSMASGASIHKDEDRSSGRNGGRRRKHCGLMLQQSAKGDVFAQRVSWAGNPYLTAGRKSNTIESALETRTPAKVGRKRPKSYSQSGDYSEDSSDAGTPSHSHSVLRSRSLPASSPATGTSGVAMRRRKNVFSQRGDGSDDDSDEASDSPENTPRRKTPATLRAAVDRTAGGQGVSRGGADQSEGLPPVQTGLPCGVRCFTATSTGEELAAGDDASHCADPVKDTKHYLKTVLRNNGLVLLNAISEADVVPPGTVRLYPAGSSSFPAFVPEDAQRGFDLIKMFPEDLRSDLPTLPSRKALLMKQKAPILTDRREGEIYLNGIKKELISFVEKEPKTLWELWKHALHSGDRRVEVNAFRTALIGQFRLLESVVPQANAAEMHGGSADPSLSDAEDSPQSSDEESRHGMRASAATVSTYDGLYVKAPAQGETPLFVYRDQSKGKEVRMSRPKGNTDECAGPDANTAGTDGSSPAEGCSCGAHIAEIISGRLALCGDRLCLVPHCLLYRIPKGGSVGTTEGSQKQPKGRAGAAHSNRSKSAEPFYWGSSLLPATAPPQLSSPQMGAQSLSQSISQSISQSQPRTPARPSAQQRGSMSTGLRSHSQAQSQSHSQVPGTPAQSFDGQMDVTDNILAVLNNNWNRAQGQTAHVDPAKTSLLMSVQQM